MRSNNFNKDYVFLKGALWKMCIGQKILLIAVLIANLQYGGNLQSVF